MSSHVRKPCWGLHGKTLWGRRPPFISIFEYSISIRKIAIQCGTTRKQLILRDQNGTGRQPPGFSHWMPWKSTIDSPLVTSSYCSFSSFHGLSLHMSPSFDAELLRFFMVHSFFPWRVHRKSLKILPPFVAGAAAASCRAAPGRDGSGTCHGHQKWWLKHQNKWELTWLNQGKMEVRLTKKKTLKTWDSTIQKLDVNSRKMWILTSKIWIPKHEIKNVVI